jgi:hypothetical protein
MQLPVWRVCIIQPARYLARNFNTFCILTIFLNLPGVTGPDWKIGKLHAGDFENLIVNIWKASKMCAEDLLRVVQKIQSVFHVNLILKEKFPTSILDLNSADYVSTLT